MNLPPSPWDVFTPGEIELSLDEELRLADDRPREARWRLAAEGAPAPDMIADEGRFVDPWPLSWQPLNEPGADEMVGLLVFDRRDRSAGLLGLASPTPLAKIWHARALREGWLTTLGLESRARDHRVIFHRARPLEAAVGRPDVVRFAVERPAAPNVPSYEVWMTSTRGAKLGAR